MMVTKFLTFLAFLFTLPAMTAQNYNYEPSGKYPFGKANPAAPEQIKEWDKLIGTCDCKSLLRNPDGSWQDTSIIVWTWKYIMDGMAVQDITLKPDGKNATSIRQFIPDSSKWYVTYFGTSPPSPSPGTWEGGITGDDIILYKNQIAPNGMEGFYKITFSEISDNGFNWLGEWVDKSESIKYPTWKIFCKQRE